jgi:hypothetical protein
MRLGLLKVLEPRNNNNKRTNNMKTGRGSAPTPFDLDEHLGPPKKDFFKENLKVGNEVEAGVRYLHALEGIPCYGVEPGVSEYGTQPKYPKEQKDIVVYRETLFIPPKPWATTHPIEENHTTPEEYRDLLIKNNLRFIEVKSFSKSFYPSIMLDCVKVWYQKTPEPTAVVLVQQSATFEELGLGAREHILVAHIPTVQGSLKEQERKVWNKSTNSHVWKTNLEVPKELCWSWTDYVEHTEVWATSPSK